MMGTDFSLPNDRTSLTSSCPGVSISSKGLLSKKSLMLAGCCSWAFMSSSIWISLSSLAASSSSVSPSAARRLTVVEKLAPVDCRRALTTDVLMKVPGRATLDRIEAVARRDTARGADRAKLRMESIVMRCDEM